MNQKYQSSEKGQAIVYLVIGFVVFLGFVALALDGGMALADRRNAQNAADAASLAGGGKAALNLENANPPITIKNWSCGNLSGVKNNAEFAAYTRALDNGFPITYTQNSDLPGSDYNYAIATCANKYIDVTVEISATTQSNFLQVLFPDALHNQVEAVTRVYPRHPIAPGNAIIALNPESCNGNQNGTVFYVNPKDDTTTTVYNGSIHSNGCSKCNGSPNIFVACDYAADPDCNPDDLGSFSEFPAEECNGTWEPSPTSPVDLIDPSDFALPTPDCSNATWSGTGNQFNKLLKPNKLYTMADGLWCINGNVKIEANYELAGNNVTLYIVNGDFSVTGTPQINLSASTDPHASPEIPGVLIYLPAPDLINPSVCTNHTVSLAGTASSTFIGSIVAPCSRVSLLGTGGNTYQGQVVGWAVNVGGDAALTLTYNENLAASQPATIKLYK
jgi:hypothetical protein